MAAGLTLNTLLDEWQWRRERIARGPWLGSQFAAEQVRVLDYLIHRYSNSVEGQRPALSPRAPAVQINDRAIVVLHHVGKNKVVGIKSAQEAESRAARILKRMASATSADPADESAVGRFAHDDAEPDSQMIVIERIRLRLSDASAQARLAAVEILGSIGDLEDIGLLSDLLALPPAADEAPEERAAQIRAMESLAHQDRAKSRQ